MSRVSSKLSARLLCGASLVAASLSLVPQARAAGALSVLDPEYTAQWGLGMIGAEIAHQRGFTGRGVNVGVVDSGIVAFSPEIPDVSMGRPGHPDLNGNLSGLSLNGEDGGAGDGIDVEGHGTHVAGIIAATRNGTGMVGVAPGARVTDLQLATRGTSNINEQALDTTAARLYDFGRQNGIEFYNNSWGSDPSMPASGPDLDTARTYFATERQQMVAALERGVAAGAIYVWANGNEGASGASYEAALPHLYEHFRPNWMAVAAVGRTGEITNYSNRCGAVAMTWCISAPGGGDDQDNDGIYSTSNQGSYIRYSGTSMAAPHVTGALAIAREMFPGARSTDLAQLVFATATDVGAAGIDEVYGWGLLNLANLTDTRNASNGAIFSQTVYAQGRTLGQIADLATGLSATIDGAAPVQGAISFSTHGGAPGGSMDMRWWSAPIAAMTSTSASATLSSALTRTGGAMTGLDFRPSSEIAFGFGVGFTETRSSGGGNSSRQTGVHGLAYASFTRDAWFVDTAAGLSRFETSTTRYGAAGAGGAVGPLVGSSSGVDVGAWGNARVGMTFATVHAQLQPYVQARATHQWLGSATESGNGVFALAAPSAASTQTDAGFGLRVTGTGFDTGIGALRPVVDVAYARAIGALGDSREVTLLGAPLGKSSIGLGRDIARVSAGVTLDAAGGRVTGTLGYSGEYRQRAASHALNASVGVRF